MNFKHALAWLLGLALLSSPALAQVTLPQVKNAGGSYVPSQASVPVDSTGADASDPVNHAVRMNCVVGCTGGGGGGGTPTGTAGTPNANVVTVQGISGASALPVSGAFYQATQPVSIASMPSTPVTGTFWQATQPVSGTVTANLGTVPTLNVQGVAGGAAIPVTGAFYQATQPVSGTVNLGTVPTLVVQGVSNGTPVPVAQSGTVNVQGVAGGAAVPVSGAFYQATQPVSIASMPSTPVTGTFWQSTQPVSIASMPTTPVTGAFYQATQPVSLAAPVALAAGNALIGSVQPAIISPTVLTSGTAYNFTTAGAVHFQVDILSSGGSVAFTGSVANGGTPYPLTQIINASTGAAATSITANGMYELLFAGGKWVTPTVTGTATVTASANQQ